MSLDRESKLAVTLGDPAGLGPEVILKALADPAAALMVTVFGSKKILQQTYDKLRSIDPATAAANPPSFRALPPHPCGRLGDAGRRNHHRAGATAAFGRKTAQRCVHQAPVE